MLKTEVSVLEGFKRGVWRTGGRIQKSLQPCDVSLEVPPADQLKYFLLLALAHFLPFIFDDGGGKLADIRYWASTSVFPR